MTIVISCLTHEYVLQVSDRRVIWVDDRNNVAEEDDNRNKAVNFCRRIAFGYAGLAEIEKGVRTDIWITETLGNLERQAIDVAAEAIRSRATACLRRLPNLSPAIKRHAFVAVGWAIPAREEAFCPLFILISNFHEESGNELPQAIDEFRTWHRFLDQSARGALYITGYQLDKDLLINLRRSLRKCAKRRLGPRLGIHLIADTIREMASRHPVEIGANLMALCIPRKSLEVNSPFYLMSPPSNEYDSFLYLPANQSGEVAYYPNFVCGGNAITGGVYMSGQLAREVITSMPPSKLPAAIILTDYAGAGTRADPRHPAIGDNFMLDSCSDITGANSWPSNSPCPYYGLLVAIDASDEVIEMIGKDNRHLIIVRGTHELDRKPPPEWIGELIAWLTQRGLALSEQEALRNKLADSTWEHIISEIQQMLRASKSSTTS